jgi:selenocysteine lyase/cysteine desulfurase
MFFHTGGTGKGLSAYGAASGSRNVPHILGHGVAIDFHNAIGRTNVETRCRALSQLVRQRLREIPALKLLTPEEPELSSGMVAFALDPAKGNNGEIFARFRAEHNIILKPAQGTYAYVPAEDVPAARPNYNAIRISTHIFNSKDEIEKMAELMKKMLA